MCEILLVLLLIMIVRYGKEIEELLKSIAATSSIEERDKRMIARFCKYVSYFSGEESRTDTPRPSL